MLLYVSYKSELTWRYEGSVIFSNHLFMHNLDLDIKVFSEVENRFHNITCAPCFMNAHDCFYMFYCK